MSTLGLIAAAVSEVARDFLSLSSALTVHERFGAQVSPIAVQDEFARFKVRSTMSTLRIHANLSRSGQETLQLTDKADDHSSTGAQSQKRLLRLSLTTDYRLRDAEHLKNEVHSLINKLSRALNNSVAIVKGERIPWDAMELSDSDAESELSTNLQGDTELTQLLESTKSIITALFRLSWVLGS
jgi:hypothetical protein